MELLKQNYLKLFTKKAKSVILLLIFAFLFDFSFFAMPVLADEAVAEDKIGITAAIAEEAEPEIVNNLPKNGVWNVDYVSDRVFTAYTSEAAQTDASPCITANGYNVCENGKEDTIAANFLKFGTKVRIPELFGDRVFIVRDRMNARYSDRVDIWMIDKQDAIKFGVKYSKLEVLE